jgi:putative oxidoreductase
MRSIAATIVTTMVRMRGFRLLAAWLVAAYLARMYVTMGWVKFDPTGFWTAAFARWGYPTWLRWLVGGIEVGGALLILVPWVASYGALALSAVMVGAWVTRARDMRFVDVAWITAYFTALVWIAFEWWPFAVHGRWRRRQSGAPPGTIGRE